MCIVRGEFAESNAQDGIDYRVCWVVFWVFIQITCYDVQMIVFSSDIALDKLENSFFGCVIGIVLPVSKQV